MIRVASTQNNPSNIQEDNQVRNNVEEVLEPPAKKNKRLRSLVWNHFEKITIDGKQKAECHACKSLLSGESNHGNSKSNLNTYVYNEKDGRMSLAKMVILHEYPLSIVDHVGFRNFTKAIQPLFNCPCRNTLKSDILKLYNQQKDQVIKGIETNKSRVAITADMWTSSNQKKGFMAITGHYIDNDWILRSKILRFLYVPCPHTSEVLTNVLMEALMEWNVDTKLSTITLDNCSTNDKLIDMVKDKLQSCHLIKDGAHIHMHCCAHILNLIVKVGLNVIKAPTENIRERISNWTATPKRVEKFEETCRQLKITYSKTLGLDCKTRWNATYLMLKTALMFKDVFTRLKQRDSHYKTLSSPLEWENARVICKKLEGAIHELMAVASVFDPRSKMEMIEFYFPQIYPDDSASRIKKVRKICEALILEYQEKTLDRKYEFGNNAGSSSANSMEVDENMSA
ncbi:zinc finger BED domain-containing protein RICESLEEPER 2-like protein [Tanacetum coccineum]